MIYVWLAFVFAVAGAGAAAFQKIASAASEMKSFKEDSHEWHDTEGEIGDEHVDRIGTEPIRHESPEVGYVILNGEKRKLDDCKNL